MSSTDIAPDGSPVAFYTRIPASGEPELIDAAVPSGASILDIGCGTGRIAGPLVALGHPVTGIDNAPGMIAALPPAIEGILGEATSVRLGRQFDAVLLASHFVNDPDNAAAILATAAAHVTPDGVVIGETYPPDWDPIGAVGTPGALGEATVTLTRAALDGDRLDAEVRYEVDGRTWHQPFTARLLDEATLRDLLADAGLRFTGWLDRPGWFTAVPMTDQMQTGSAPTRE